MSYNKNYFGKINEEADCSTQEERNALGSNDLRKELYVVELMKSSKNEKEWNANCDKVKAENGNKYPDFWYSAIVVSGIAGNMIFKWNKRD